MFQKEMSDRITGSYGTSNYGRLSILANYRLDIISKFNVSPNCFSPKPKVDSIVIHFKPKEKTHFFIKDLRNLEKVTKILLENNIFNEKVATVQKNDFEVIDDLKIDINELCKINNSWYNKY